METGRPGRAADRGQVASLTTLQISQLGLAHDRRADHACKPLALATAQLADAEHRPVAGAEHRRSGRVLKTSQVQALTTNQLVSLTMRPAAAPEHRRSSTR
jgi:hypothetical protein